MAAVRADRGWREGFGHPRNKFIGIGISFAFYFVSFFLFFLVGEASGDGRFWRLIWGVWCGREVSS